VTQILQEIDLYPGFDKNSPAILAPIEPGIKPVCEALNSIPNVHTIWSCDGHPWQQKQPYVVFITDQDTAFRVSRLLDVEHEAGWLHYCWSLSANFRDDGSLQYTIKPSDYRLYDGSMHWWSLCLWNRKAIIKELNNLALSIAKL
jgi:hypothetical protein